jgi:hypothetical protein
MAQPTPTPTGIVDLDDQAAQLASRHPDGPSGLEAVLASFERARARYDNQVFEAVRHVSDHLAVIAVDAVSADSATYVPLPKAGG